MLSEIYNKIGGAAQKIGGTISDVFRSKPIVYDREEYLKSKGLPSEIYNEPKYNLPPVISKEHIPTFVEQAKLAGLTPEEFGTIARREQGANTLPHQAAMVGGVDPSDKGLMQVNTLHDKLVKERFLKELGRPYNPKNPVDSIIAARMVLEENRRQIEQMRINQTYPWELNNEDLLMSYNLGPEGLKQSKKGNVEKIKRAERYQQAGTN